MHAEMPRSGVVQPRCNPRATRGATPGTTPFQPPSNGVRHIPLIPQALPALGRRCTPLQSRGTLMGALPNSETEAVAKWRQRRREKELPIHD